MGLGKPKLCIKFEVANFSHCVNIKGEPPNFDELLYPRAMPTLSSACNFMMGFGKPQLLAKFEVAIFSRCKNIKGEAPNFGELP